MTVDAAAWPWHFLLWCHTCWQSNSAVPVCIACQAICFHLLYRQPAICTLYPSQWICVHIVLNESCASMFSSHKKRTDDRFNSSSVNDKHTGKEWESVDTGYIQLYICDRELANARSEKSLLAVGSFLSIVPPRGVLFTNLPDLGVLYSHTR